MVSVASFWKKKRKERKESGLSNKIELSKAHKINHVRKMKGARRADGLRVCTASRALVCGPLKATVSAHHLTEVNGPTQAVDLLIFLHALGDRVTEWHTHTHTQAPSKTLSIIPSLPVCLSLPQLQRIPGGEGIHSHATPTSDILDKWQQWQFGTILRIRSIINICDYEQICTTEVSNVYMDALLPHYKVGSANRPN